MRHSTFQCRTYRTFEFIDVLTEVGLHPANSEECDAGRAIAAELISPHVALAPTFHRVQSLTGAAISVCAQDGAVAGVMGMVPLTPAGLDAVQTHLFDPKNPPADHLCRDGDPFAAVYGWGLAATTRKASATVLLGALTLRKRFSDLPFFTRAATPAGARVIYGRLGYAPYPGAPGDLLWNSVPPSQERAA